ncbi:hypothetical protein DNTS_007076 [Danionella cerebrum]|uniref:Kazal-like domain-containing protein n=1 Tax=Danionella cerebrum TaxID=2873325 RepID=A0A553N369_9TELE|nr:hypothetical protein DNTS_007076 [Danionella translucida]
MGTVIHVTPASQLCNNDYVPVCGSNNENYENECFLRRDACKQQSEILVVSEGSCPADAGSGSGDEAWNYTYGECGDEQRRANTVCVKKQKTSDKQPKNVHIDKTSAEWKREEKWKADKEKDKGREGRER